MLEGMMPNNKTKITVARLRSITKKIETGKSTLLAEANALGYASDVTLRKALVDHLGSMAAYRAVIKSGTAARRDGAGKPTAKSAAKPTAKPTAKSAAKPTAARKHGGKKDRELLIQLLRDAPTIEDAWRAIRKTFDRDKWGKVRDIVRALTDHNTFANAFAAEHDGEKLHRWDE